jgi:hypothetical protein
MVGRCDLWPYFLSPLLQSFGFIKYYYDPKTVGGGANISVFRLFCSVKRGIWLVIILIIALSLTSPISRVGTEGIRTEGLEETRLLLT